MLLAPRPHSTEQANVSSGVPPSSPQPLSSQFPFLHPRPHQRSLSPAAAQPFPHPPPSYPLTLPTNQGAAPQPLQNNLNSFSDSKPSHTVESTTI